MFRQGESITIFFEIILHDLNHPSGIHDRTTSPARCFLRFNRSKLRCESPPSPQIKKTDWLKPISLFKSGRGELPLRVDDILSSSSRPGLELPVPSMAPLPPSRSALKPVQFPQPPNKKDRLAKADQSFKSGRGELNPRPLGPEPSALPLRYYP